MITTAEPLVFKIVVDDSGVAPASSRTQDALGALGARAGTGAKQFTQLRKDTALTRQEVLALNYTVSDVAASLASGASPFTILLQQGGQVKDAFGGFGNLVSKLSSVLTVGRVALGGLALAAGSAGYAFYEGAQQSRAFEKALQLTGNRAGLTAASFDAMAGSIAAQSKVSIGMSREVLQAAVETGQFGSTAIGAVSAAAATLARATGRSAADVVKDFATMSAGVAKWAADHNRSYAYLTVEQYKYIRSLEAQGRAEEAMRVNAEALDKALKDRQPELGTLQKLWEGLKNTASGAWDAMLAVGRTETGDQVMARLRAQLAYQKETLAYESDGRATKAQLDGRRAIIEKIEAQLDAQRELNKFQEQGAAAAARNAAANAKAIEDQSKGSVDRRLELERSLFTQSQAFRDLAREREALADKRALDIGELNATAYMNRRIARERGALADKEAAINEEIALERKRVVEKPEDVVAQQAKLVELETRRVSVQRERLQLQDRIQRGELYAPGPAPLESAQQQFIKFERARQADTEKGIRERAVASAEGVSEILRINREASIALIQDDLARGTAQIAYEESEIRKRLDLAAMSVEGRKTAEEALAQWRVLRERQLTEELKPEYQKQLDLYADFNRSMQKDSDEFRAGFIDSGREMFATWVRDGKLSAKRLTDFIIDKFASMVYDRYLASAFDALGQSVFRALTGFGGGGGSLSVDTGGFGIGGGLTSLVDLGLGAGRASGGSVQRGSLYPVNELGTELLTVRGRDYLMMGADNGTVTPADRLGGKSVSIDASTGSLVVGPGVSMSQVQAVVQQNNARQLERIRRLIDQGRL